VVAAGPSVGSEQEMLARSLGALLSVRRFDSPIHLARAVHGASLTLAMFADNLPAADGPRLRELRRRSLEVALSVDSRGIAEADRDWLVATMRSVLAKASATVAAEDRLH
jgi:hypothetical protein